MLFFSLNKFPAVFDRAQRERGPFSDTDDEYIVMYEAIGVHTNHMEYAQALRVSKNFKGASWEDGLQVFTINSLLKCCL